MTLYPRDRNGVINLEQLLWEKSGNIRVTQNFYYSNFPSCALSVLNCFYKPWNYLTNTFVGSRNRAELSPKGQGVSMAESSYSSAPGGCWGVHGAFVWGCSTLCGSCPESDPDAERYSACEKNTWRMGRTRLKADYKFTAGQRSSGALIL